MPATQVDLKSPVAGDTGRWPKLKLAALQTTAWSETKAAMIWAVPCYADIWLAMMIDKDGEHAWWTDNIETAATDDKFIYANPSFFFKLTLDERLFVSCHEIGHAAGGHAGLFHLLQKQGHVDYPDGKRLPFDYDLANCAADYVLNDQLISAKIGKMPEGGLHWPMKDGQPFITGDMAVLEAFRKLYEEEQKLPNSWGNKSLKRTTKNGQDQGPGSGKSFDKLLPPGGGTGKTPNKAMSERKQTDWDMAVQAAMESAKLRGQLPANLERLFVKRLNPKADWRDLYAIAVSKKIGNARYTWEMLNQQFAYRSIGVPGRTSFGCNLVVIAVDTSGSINQHTLDVFLAETTALLEQARPRQVVFTQCDAYIHEWSSIDGTDDLYGCKLKGGGGTSFVPVFERIEAEGLSPDMLVYLTDGMGDFPRVAPSYPVVWGSIELAPSGYPFGEVVMVPPQSESA